MKYYLSNILPRLKQFSLDLDRKEVFTDKPWVFVDVNGNQQKYIFKRNGELLMSFNGQVLIGKWEYLSGAKSLLIDRISDKILLNQNFINEAVMILKKDGTQNERLCLANELLLPDLDVNKYLQELYYEKNFITAASLHNGNTLEIKFFNGHLKYKPVTIEGENVPDGHLFVLTKDGEKKIEIRNSEISRILILKEYNTPQDKIFIEQDRDSNAAKGDFVYLEDTSRAPDGKYRLGAIDNIMIRRGVIV